MKFSYPHLPTMFLMVFLLLTFASCNKDSDLFYESILDPEKPVVEDPTSQDPDENPTNEEPGTDPGPFDGIDLDTPDNFDNPNKIEGTYYPSSAAEISDSSKANFKAIITESFDCNGCTFASNQTIEPAGGVISGSNINLNGAYIENTYKQAFSASVSFSQIYKDSRVSPETFGAQSGDSTQDDAAIDAMINNCEYGVGSSNGKYIKNEESTYGRPGKFNWNMNSAVVETTSGSNLSHGSSTSNELVFLFFFNGTRPEIYNGAFDGNDIASRLFRVDKTNGFYFNGLNVHNYLSPPSAYARAVAFKLDIQANSNYNFSQGEISNCTITDIGATSDGNANNSPYGVSKAIWASESSDGREAQVYFANNRINNIYGDDAEGFYNDKYWGGSYSYSSSNVKYIFDNEDYRACQRRAMKITLSNATITNSYFESATNAPIFAGAQATLVHVFSTSGSNQPLDDINFRNNEIRIVGNAQNNPLGFTDIKDCAFEDNIISCDTFTAYSYIGFGTGISNPYSGDFENVSIKRNTIINTFCHFDSVYDPINGGPDFADNTVDITWSENPGAYLGVFRIFPSSGSYPEFHATNIDININLATSTGTTLFGGVFNTWGAEPKNWVFDDVDITWTGGSPAYGFAYTGKNNTASDFDSTNLITNCDVKGVTGAGAVFVKGGDKSVRIQNSYGDNSVALSVQ